MISMLLDPDPLTESEKTQFTEKANRMGIGIMTPADWTRETGQSGDSLAAFVKANCRIHNIRNFLTGEEQLGKYPKLIVIESPAGNNLFLVSLRPELLGATL
jgi:hypothetical protein